MHHANAPQQHGHAAEKVDQNEVPKSFMLEGRQVVEAALKTDRAASGPKVISDDERERDHRSPP